MFNIISLIYATVFFTLFAIDYILGNGFVDMSQKIFCRIPCLIKKTLMEEVHKIQTSGIESPLSLPMILTEILLLSLTLAIYNRFKRSRKVDRIGELLQQSKAEIHNANMFLDKWRLRKVATDTSYLDDEPQVIKPLKLEVPILHMAIIDTLGTSRSQPERGDAGDTINITDSAILSITSLIDEDIESTPDNQESSSEEKIDERCIEYNNRYLWDVMEEDNVSVDRD